MDTFTFMIYAILGIVVAGSLRKLWANSKYWHYIFMSCVFTGILCMAFEIILDSLFTGTLYVSDFAYKGLGGGIGSGLIMGIIMEKIVKPKK